MLYGELPAAKNGDDPIKGFRFTVANPPKSAILRLPTNDEMLERLDKQRSVRTSLGRRKAQNEVIPNPGADLALFVKIRVDQGAEFDEYEASNAIQKLTACDVIDCERDGDGCRVRLKTPFGETVHNLGIPKIKDLMFYRRAVVSSIELPHGKQELRWRASAAAELYDSVVRGVEGYVPGKAPEVVPPHHKLAIALDFEQFLDDTDESFNPNA